MSRIMTAISLPDGATEAATVADIPSLWNAKYKQYLGLDVSNDYKNGPMQDVHWASGTLGYFPSYTLGAMYAAQFMWALTRAAEAKSSSSWQSLDAMIERGDFSFVHSWFREHLWSRASLYSVDEIVRDATGEVLNGKFYRAHLERRYLGRGIV